LALLFFNVGVELGQLLFVTTVIAAGWLLHILFTQQWRLRAEVVTAYIIGTIAVYWTIERISTFSV